MSFSGIKNEKLWISEYDSNKKNEEQIKGVESSCILLKEAEFRNGVGVRYIHEFVNTLGIGHDNDCGQAAIATMMQFWNKNTHEDLSYNCYDSNDRRYYPGNNEMVNSVWKEYPADAPFKWWTWKEQVANGLKGFGLSNVGVGYACFASNGQDAWNNVYEWLKAGYPVVVLIDWGPLTGDNWLFHYSVLHYFDGERVYLTNMGGYNVLEWKLFMSSWWCRGLPYPNNFVYIVGQP